MINVKTKIFKKKLLLISFSLKKINSSTNVVSIIKEEKIITDKGLWKIFELESKLLRVILDMRFKGVPIDLDKAQRLAIETSKEEDQTLSAIYQEAEFKVSPWSALELAEAFNRLKIWYPKTEKGNPSFTSYWLNNHTHPFAKKIAHYRKINKMRRDFIEGLCLKMSHKGRIYAQFHSLRKDSDGTRSGRFSSSTPNLQQIPARDEHWGPLIRSLFLPEEGMKWACLDYSQQEPRILVHFASLMKLEGTGAIVDAYNDGSADFHQMIADMAGIDRKQAKTINLGIMYGMGKNKLMAELGLMKDAAEKLLKTYHQRAPFVKMLSEAVSRRADDSGKIRTIGGRLCHFDMWEPHGFGIKKPLKHADALREHGPGIKRAFTYKALNKLIQGSAADMTKQSMLALYREGIIPHVQIHDELDISISGPEESERIIRIMEEAVQLQVPNKVDYEKGESWGDIK